ncbi:MAG: hypothetical protein ACK55Z_00595, partial [bacterium]
LVISSSTTAADVAQPHNSTNKLCSLLFRQCPCLQGSTRACLPSRRCSPLGKCPAPCFLSSSKVKCRHR